MARTSSPAYLEDLEVVGESECGNVRVTATMTKTVQLFSDISEPNSKLQFARRGDPPRRTIDRHRPRFLLHLVPGPVFNYPLSLAHSRPHLSAQLILAPTLQLHLGRWEQVCDKIDRGGNCNHISLE